MHRICQHCAIRIGGDIMVRDKVSTDILWKDRKRILFLGLPWSFTRYSVSKDRFFISKGFFSVKDDEVRLYRIMDISLERSFMQRLVGVGTIKVCSGDKTMGDFEINLYKAFKTLVFSITKFLNASTTGDMYVLLSLTI